MSSKSIELIEHSKSGDSTALYKSAHAIKSMSANIGAGKMKSISAKIEEQGRNGDLSDVFEMIGNLQKAYDEFLIEFESEIMTEY